AGSLINFQNSSTGSNLSYVWDFGDATFDNAQHPQHVYSSEGNFDIKLVVIDEFTCSDTIQKVQQIEIINPIANFHSDTNFADCPPLMVHFTNESQNSLEYKWDFGDMSGVSNLENPDHIYTYPGNYDVSLIAINDVCSDTLFFDDYININGPRGGFNYIVDTTCLPVKVTFIGQSNGIYRFNWDFGNNEIISSTTLKDRDTLIYYYTSAGIFLPKLILIDENIVGCVSVIQATKPINIPTFAIDFQSPIQQRCGLGHPINFINLSSSNQNFNFIEWNFEGGTPTISTEFEPIIVYNQEGIFDVTLIISNSFCKDTLIKENYIRIEDNPIAQFTLNNNIGCQPFNAITSNQSTSTLGTINQTIWTINNDSLYDYNISHLFVDTGMFDIKLTVVTAAGCIDSSSHSVQILPLANYDLLFTGEDTICIGGTTQLLATISSDTTGLTYYWTGEGLSCTSCLDPVVTPLSTNTYYFNVTNLVGCTSSLPLTVEVRNIALPEVSISPDQNICQGESIQLNVSGGDNVFSYQWDTTQIGLNCYNYCFNPIAHPDTSTTYYVAVTNQVYCTSIDSVTINVIEPPIDLPTPNEIICLGDSVQLNIAYGTNPHWLNPSHLSCSFCPDPIANPVISTTYLVSVDFQNCQFIDTFSVQIFDKNSISAGIDTTICLGSTTTLSAVGEGIISWSPTDLVSDPTILNPVVEPLSTTEFILEVTNGDCIVYDSILVNVIEKSDISALDTVICLGETVPLNVVGNFDKLEWTDLNIIQNNHYDFPSVSPDSSSVYEVIGTFSTCLPDTAQAMVFVENPPTIMIQDRYSFFYENTFTLTPEVVSNNPVSYEWISDFPLTCNDCPSTSIFVDSSTMVIVKVRDEITGCVNTDSIYFREITSCSDELIFVPNAFSPNDDTQNDVFKIYSSTIDEIKFLKIFDRWGNLIFETHDINIGWDGKFNGKSLPQGVYVVIIDAVCVLDAKPIHIKTDVTLLK
ncbi:MAG: PKD domain-containing protein, partial [Saprospiraceae bacterium]|nr:PKD domain-containing protein [Saprospiraceae bacterium]